MKKSALAALPPRAAMLGRALCSARGLSCGYAGRLVLENVDLDIKAGEVLAVIGPNGSGKTTLFRTLSGELPPLGGEACLLGLRGMLPVADIPRRERAGLVGRVLQAEQPSWPTSVREYIEAGTFASTGWFGTQSRLFA